MTTITLEKYSDIEIKEIAAEYPIAILNGFLLMESPDDPAEREAYLQKFPLLRDFITEIFNDGKLNEWLDGGDLEFGWSEWLEKFAESIFYNKRIPHTTAIESEFTHHELLLNVGNYLADIVIDSNRHSKQRDLIEWQNAGDKISENNPFSLVREIHGKDLAMALFDAYESLADYLDELASCRDQAE